VYEVSVTMLNKKLSVIRCVRLQIDETPELDKSNFDTHSRICNKVALPIFSED